MSRFGGSLEVIGSTLRHDRGVSTIVGVLSSGVEIPMRKADPLLPMDRALLRDEDARWLQVFARLVPETSSERAGVEVSAVARRAATIDPAEVLRSE